LILSDQFGYSEKTLLDPRRETQYRRDTFRVYNTVMITVSLQELQQDPNALLDRVEAGEHLLVIRGGRPVAELRPVPPAQRASRPFGLCAGEFVVPDDFDAPLPDDVLRDFEGQ
jgi:antitoxin (DNA-binding transcriptional repressor) of toxin-antitoxin stability system